MAGSMACARSGGDRRQLTAFATGGSGFFGGVLKRRLLDDGFGCVSLDLHPDTDVHPALVSVRGDVRDTALLDSLFDRHQFSAVFHCAALLAHEIHDRDLLWSSNVEGTAAIAEAANRHGRPRIVFISSNCLWASPFNRPVTEADVPAPIEIYGQSKAAAEQSLLRITGGENAVILRTPTIIFPTPRAPLDPVRLHPRRPPGLGGGPRRQPLSVRLCARSR